VVVLLVPGVWGGVAAGELGTVLDDRGAGVGLAAGPPPPAHPDTANTTSVAAVRLHLARVTGTG
jgi:hypothetical protein